MGSDNSSEIEGLRKQLSDQRRDFEKLIESKGKMEKQRLDRMMANHKETIEEMRNDAEEREKKYEEERKLEQQKTKELMERIEKEKEEEKRKKLEEELRRVEEAKKLKKDFQRRVEDIKIDKVEKIKKKLKTEENTFCLEEISKFDIEKIRLLIIDLFKAEKILSFTNNSLRNFIRDSNKEVKTVEHLNIVVVGPSGVGKSTLINAILNSENLTP